MYLLYRKYYRHLAIMGWTCCAPGCTIGYKTKEGLSKPDGVILHEFPKDPVMFAKWKSSIPRKDWEPSKSSRICSLHFVEHNYGIESQDQTKRSKTTSGQRLEKRLKADAFPSVFPNLSKLFEKTISPPRKQVLQLLNVA